VDTRLAGLLTQFKMGSLDAHNRPSALAFDVIDLGKIAAMPAS
jgi:hypothetical protein